MSVRRILKHQVFDKIHKRGLADFAEIENKAKIDFLRVDFISCRKFKDPKRINKSIYNRTKDYPLSCFLDKLQNAELCSKKG